NKAKYDSLPQNMKALIANAVEAASADMSWKAIDRYSQDYIEMQKQGVKFYATPTSILQQQLKVWDEVVKKKEAENPMFKKVNARCAGLARPPPSGRAAPWGISVTRHNHSSAARKAG